ncbi:hypothetical protein Tco_0103406 [Tanacetum coccineum]
MKSQSRLQDNLISHRIAIYTSSEDVSLSLKCSNVVLLAMIIMANLPSPNNDPNVLEDEHALAPEHAPIAPNLAPLDP